MNTNQAFQRMLFNEKLTPITMADLTYYLEQNESQIYYLNNFSYLYFVGVYA